jgi:hypothetical protein
MTVAMVGLATTAATQSTHPYVGYYVCETRRTATDERECRTQVSLMANDCLSFSYREDVRGCIDSVVRSVDYTNVQWNVPAEAQAELVQDLLAANVFDLASEERSGSDDDLSSLDVRIGDRDEQWMFWSPPTSPDRKAIHKIILAFAQRMDVDRPGEPDTTVIESEGDLQPVRDVLLAELLVFPEKYQGQRVSVVGYYRDEFEGQSFSIGPSGYDSDLERSLWRSELSSFAKAEDIDAREEGWLRIDGVFLRGPAGHMGAYPGEIVRITRVQPAPPPVPTPGGPTLWPSSGWAFVMAFGPMLLLPFVTIWLVRALSRAIDTQGNQPDGPKDGGTGSRS